MILIARTNAMRAKYAVILFLAVLPMIGTAQDITNKPLAVAAITGQQSEIREDLLAGKGRYKDMPRAKKDELLAKQATLMTLLDGKRSTDDLSSSERIEAFNTLEWIEAAINNAESERMVCASERTIGSNRKTRVCKTVAQLAREREEARRRVDNGMDVYGTK